jgi:hypothetical protein
MLIYRNPPNQSSNPGKYECPIHDCLGLKNPKRPFATNQKTFHLLKAHYMKVIFLF